MSGHAPSRGLAGAGLIHEDELDAAMQDDVPDAPATQGRIDELLHDAKGLLLGVLLAAAAAATAGHAGKPGKAQKLEQLQKAVTKLKGAASLERRDVQALLRQLARPSTGTTADMGTELEAALEELKADGGSLDDIMNLTAFGFPSDKSYAPLAERPALQATSRLAAFSDERAQLLAEQRRQLLRAPRAGTELYTTLLNKGNMIINMWEPSLHAAISAIPDGAAEARSRYQLDSQSKLVLAPSIAHAMQYKMGEGVAERLFALARFSHKFDVLAKVRFGHLTYDHALPYVSPEAVPFLPEGSHGSSGTVTVEFIGHYDVEKTGGNHEVIDALDSYSTGTFMAAFLKEAGMDASDIAFADLIEVPSKVRRNGKVVRTPYEAGSGAELPARRDRYDEQSEELAPMHAAHAAHALSRLVLLWLAGVVEHRMLTYGAPARDYAPKLYEVAEAAFVEYLALLLAVAALPPTELEARLRDVGGANVASSAELWVACLSGRTCVDEATQVRSWLAQHPMPSQSFVHCPHFCAPWLPGIGTTVYAVFEGHPRRPASRVCLATSNTKANDQERKKVAKAAAAHAGKASWSHARRARRELELAFWLGL